MNGARFVLLEPGTTHRPQRPPHSAPTLGRQTMALAASAMDFGGTLGRGPTRLLDYSRRCRYRESPAVLRETRLDWRIAGRCARSRDVPAGTYGFSGIARPTLGRQDAVPRG
jgi:hypothetical protein